jgi:hypothetical protein
VLCGTAFERLFQILTAQIPEDLSFLTLSFQTILDIFGEVALSLMTSIFLEFWEF